MVEDTFFVGWWYRMTDRPRRSWCADADHYLTLIARVIHHLILEFTPRLSARRFVRVLIGYGRASRRGDQGCVSCHCRSNSGILYTIFVALTHLNVPDSSATEYSSYEESGRLYHGYRRGVYLYPCDEDEQDRLDLHDRVSEVRYPALWAA